MTTPLPPRRRRARGPERQATVNDAMVPGALRGRIPMAAPVGTNEWREARARGVAAVSTPPPVWVRDRFPESGELASVPATLDLTFLPLPNTPVVVELNGIVADEGTDYTVSGKTVTVLAAWDVRVGDVVDVRYPYLSGMPDVPTPLVVPGGPYVGGAANGSFTATNVNIGMPASSAGDLLVMGVVVDNVTLSTPTGWTLAGSVALAGQYALYVFYKTSSGAESNPSMVPSGTTWFAGACLAYSDSVYSSITINTGPVAATSHAAPAPSDTGRIVYFWGRGLGSVAIADATERLDFDAGSVVHVSAADAVGSGAATATGASSKWVAAAVRLVGP